MGERTGLTTFIFASTNEVEKMNEAVVTALIVKKPIEITNRLAELGWTVDELLEIVSAMVRARNSCTLNHPAGAPGWFAWAEGVFRTREIGLPKGLARDDVDGIPWTLDKKRNVRFTVSNTDDGTSMDGRIPQQRSKKGPGTDRAVDANQISIFDYLPETPAIPLSKVQTHPGITVSWYLCVYSEGDVVRAELSCPTVTDGGLFADFSERIFLIGDEPPGHLIKRKGDGDDYDDGASEFEITVTRK